MHNKIPTFGDCLQMLNVFIDEICLFEQLEKFAYSIRICFNCLETLRDSHCRSVQPFTSERFQLVLEVDVSGCGVQYSFPVRPKEIL